MAKFIGRLLDIGVARESTRGTSVAPVIRFPQTTLSLDDKVVKARSIGGLGTLADSEESFVTTKYGQGDLEGEIRSKGFGYLLYAMLGGYTAPAAPLDSAYIHPFTVSQSNTHQSLCFTVVDPNTSESYPLVMLDSLAITSELDEVVRYTASFMSKKGNSTGNTVPAAVHEYKFTKKHLRFKIAANIASLSSASAISLKSLTLTIAKNVALDDVLGTAEPEDIYNRQLSVEGTITLNYVADTYKNYMKDGNHKAVEIAFINRDVTIGAGNTYPSLKIQLPKVDFFDWEPDYSLDEIVSETFSFKASRDVAGGQDIIHLCELINGVNDYSSATPTGFSPSASVSPSSSESLSVSPSASVSPSVSVSPSASASPSGSPSPSRSPSEA